MKIRNRFKARARIVIAAALIVSADANASMVGDLLSIERLFPDLETHASRTVSTTVVLGSDDRVPILGTDDDPFGIINPEADSIEISWDLSSAYAGDDTIFDGYRFTGFSGIISSVAATDVNNITIAGLSYGPHFIALNLSGAFNGTSRLTLQLQFAPVPNPSALLLFSSALAGTVALRKFWR